MLEEFITKPGTSNKYMFLSVIHLTHFGENSIAFLLKCCNKALPDLRKSKIDEMSCT